MVAVTMTPLIFIAKPPGQPLPMPIRSAEANFRSVHAHGDEVVTPQIGLHDFARYVEPAFATQVILTARLTVVRTRGLAEPFRGLENEEPLLLERGVSVNVQPTVAQPELPKPPKKNNPTPSRKLPNSGWLMQRREKPSVGWDEADHDRYSHDERRAQQQRQSAKTSSEDGRRSVTR